MFSGPKLLIQPSCYLTMQKHGAHCTFPAPATAAHARVACADYPASTTPDGSTHAENATNQDTVFHLTSIYHFCLPV